MQQKYTDHGTEAPVYWITGLSGAGKSTLGNLLYKKLKIANAATVYLDGDTLREVYGNDHGHDQSSRKAVAQRNARLCQLLSSQGIQVVCATISLFHEVQRWNRNNISNYVEIYLSTPIETIKSRCSKGLYNSSSRLMVGQDIAAEYPEKPNYTFDTTDLSPLAIIEIIADSEGL